MWFEEVRDVAGRRVRVGVDDATRLITLDRYDDAGRLVWSHVIDGDEAGRLADAFAQAAEEVKRAGGRVVSVDVDALLQRGD
jgi:hypothetical protein